MYGFPVPVVTNHHQLSDCCRCSVPQSCPTPCDPTDCSTPGFSVLPYPPELVIPSNHLIFCCSLLPPSIFPSIRAFSNESALRIRWPKFWSFSTSPSKECSGLISFRMDWFNLLVIQRTLQSLLQHHLEKFSAVCCDPHSQRLWHNQEGRCFSGIFLLF